MKNINQILSFLILVLLVGSCTPDEISMGEKEIQPGELVEGIAFTIEHDATNPNIIYLKSLMDSRYTPLWNHPQGRSQEKEVTLKIPFAGSYEVKFGVLTPGGYVMGEAVTFEVEEMYPDFIKDELWDLISGGIGNSKTWYLDLDAEGVSRYFAGPLYFYGTNNGWNGNCYGDDCWNWNPDYAGNTWLMGAADFGSMTFSLTDGAYISVDHQSLGRQEEGTFLLDTENHTMKMVDAGPLHDSGRDGQVIDWGNLVIFSLTEDYMQLGALRDEALSGEGACLLVYNFISKDYYDNWVPEEVEEPEPVLPDGWQDDVSQSVNYTVNWVLSDETPFNWANLDGTLMNTGWTSPETYADWTSFDASIPATYSGFSLEMNSQTNTVEYTAPDGTSHSGTFTLDENGVYTFVDVIPSFNICGGIDLATTAENQWRILQIEYDDFGSIAGMWVGARSTEKDEYLAYHLIPQAGSTEVDPMVAWKAALVGKTFKPDVNWFVDWVSDYPDFTGGWTTSSTFGDDYTSNGWVWDESVRNIAESASITFYEENGEIKVDVAQTLTTEHQDESENWITDGVDNSYSVTGTVTIDTETGILTIDVPLISYAGSPARWLGSNGNEGQWYFVSHGGSSLSTIDENGLWLGYTTNPGAESAILHYLVSN